MFFSIVKNEDATPMFFQLVEKIRFDKRDVFIILTLTGYFILSIVYC